MPHNDARERDYSIRLATLDDVDGMTALHCASFTEASHVPMNFGSNYIRANYRWLVTSGQSYALLAVTEREILGLVAVCDRPFTKAMFLACLGEFCLALLRNPLLLGRLRLWRRLFRRPDANKKSRDVVDRPGFAQMTIGAVSEAARGRGVFPALIEATKEVSERRGSRAIRAGIYRGNTPSRRAFEKGGWSLVRELETDETVFYVSFLDDQFASEIGLEVAGHPASSPGAGPKVDA